MGYVGILIGLFHKILFGGSVSRQKAAVKVCAVFLLLSAFSVSVYDRTAHPEWFFMSIKTLAGQFASNGLR